MAMFPKIQSPCPYKDQLATVMDGDFCRMCKRNVVDLTHMRDDERTTFLRSCEGKVCVSYRLPLRPALAAAALAASVAALPVAARPQDEPTVPIAAAGNEAASGDEFEIIVGGINDPKNVEFIEDATDAEIPALPVTYDKPAPAKAASRPAR